jgi:carboxyl-terminal processing protease
VGEFQSQLSTEASLLVYIWEESEEGGIIISGLLPGGPAWKSNELHKNDLITSLKWEGKPAIDLIGADMEEAGEI